MDYDSDEWLNDDECENEKGNIKAIRGMKHKWRMTNTTTTIPATTFI